jgi:hypothetical protein
MTSKLSPQVQAERRIAAARAARVPVDSQGKPKGKPTRFVYDPDTNLLVSATPAPPEDED